MYLHSSKKSLIEYGLENPEAMSSVLKELDSALYSYEYEIKKLERENELLNTLVGHLKDIIVSIKGGESNDNGV